MARMRELGRSGIKVSAICLGTMTFGDQTPEHDAFAQMDLALERGVTFFDTAEMYASPPKAETQGETERIIGRWLKHGGARDKIVLASKAAGRSRDMLWLRPEPELDNGQVRLTKKQIDFALEQSLRRLQTDYIDLYQTHWPDRLYRGFGFQYYRDYKEDFIAFEETLEALMRHVEKGTIRAIGVSNESPWGVMRYLAAADARGWPRIVSIQNAYNLVNRRFETGGLAEIALRDKVGLLAYSPLAQGCLTGKYLGGALPLGARKTLYNRLQRYEGPGADEAISAYVALARALGVTPVQLALKFVDTRPWTTATILGASNVKQLEEDLAAFDVAWTEEMEARVNAIQSAHPDPCP
jgi:aryl-alcohol dehydrogenase-like predicted oxidoreductase